MNSIYKFSEKNTSAIWSISLVGFPIVIVLFLVIGGMYESGRFGFLLTVVSKVLILSLALLALFNFIFCLYSSIRIIRFKSVSLGLISLVCSFLSVGLVAYFFYWFWRAQNVDLLTVKGKSFFDVFALFFYGLFIFIVLISLYFVGHDFGRF